MGDRFIFTIGIPMVVVGWYFYIETTTGVDMFGFDALEIIVNPRRSFDNVNTRGRDEVQFVTTGGTVDFQNDNIWFHQWR